MEPGKIRGREREGKRGREMERKGVLVRGKEREREGKRWGERECW